VSALTDGFWKAAERRELVRPVCRDCGRNFFTPQVACPGCLSENWSYEPSSGRGRVYSATVVHKASTPGVDVPFHLGIVDLDEGWSMLTTLDRALPIGAPVEVTWVGNVPAFRGIA
jgi:uncharacterized protein